MDDLDMMHEDDTIDVVAPFYQEANQPHLFVQDKEDGGDKAMARDAATAAPGGLPYLDVDGGFDDYQGDVEYIANNIDDFGDDFLILAGDDFWLADKDTSMPSSPGREIVASSPEQGIFSSDATSSTTMSIVPEPTEAEASVFVVAKAVGITTPETGRGDPSGSVSADDAEVYAPVGIPVATPSNSNRNDGALNMSSASAPPATSSNAVPVTAVAEIAAIDASRFIGDAPSIGVPMAIVSLTGGGSGASNARAEAISRYLAKRKRRNWAKASSYKSRQKVANSRPRHKGRFLPLQSEFVPVAELQRRQWMLFRERQERAARTPQELGASAPDDAPLMFGQ